MSEHAMVRVREVMKPHFDTVDGMSTVAQALERMLHVDTKSLIVRKRHDDDEYGMVLISDIARQVLAQDRSPERVNIYEIMSKPLLSVNPDMDIRYCARLFNRFDLSRAPVVENGEVIGIVSLTDLVIKGMLPRLPRP
jgi:CBS domain-containing protein